MLGSVIGIIIVLGLVAEKRECDSAQGNYKVITGCSVEMYEQNKGAFRGFPKEIKDEPRR
jgi:hypothetical protein